MSSTRTTENPAAATGAPNRPDARWSADFRTFLAWPDAARADLASVLGPAVEATSLDGWKAERTAFAEAHDMPQTAVLRGVSACASIVERGAIHDLDRAAFARELEAMAEGDEDAVAPIVSLYDKTKQYMRLRMLEATLADHGNVLTGLDWRVDRITASDRGARLDADVVLLTLRYRDDTSSGRLTLQLTPQSIRQLGEFLARFDAS